MVAVRQAEDVAIESFALMAYRQARAMVEEAAAQSSGLRAEVREMREKAMHSLAETLAVMRQKAESDATSLLAQAEREATAIREAAERDAREIRRHALEESRAVYQKADAEARAVLEGVRPERTSWLGAPARFFLGV